MATQVVHTAVRSGLVDELGAEPAAAETLAGRLGVDPSTLLRLLRGLVVLGLVTVDEEGAFASTALLAPLRSDASESLRDGALFLGGAVYRAWGELTAAALAGESPYERAAGKTLWGHIAADPEYAEVFNGAMRGLSAGPQRALVRALDVEGLTVMDVGGGHGHLVVALLEANPHARGIVFDQSYLEREASSFIAQRYLSERCRFEGGDFFDSVPAADVQLMKWILHDWSDDDCRAILKTCRRSIARDGRLVVVERPLPELGALGESARAAVMADLNMLAVFGPVAGRERTDAEYASLLRQSGFSLRERTPLTDGFVAFVASPV